MLRLFWNVYRSSDFPRKLYVKICRSAGTLPGSGNNMGESSRRDAESSDMFRHGVESCAVDKAAASYLNVLYLLYGSHASGPNMPATGTWVRR